MDFEKIEGKTYDEERALYNIKNKEIINCKFEGPQDGESVLKESRNTIVNHCYFDLRYPMWHNRKFILKDSNMNENTRAPLWYCINGVIEDSIINGIKCLRESKNITIKNLHAISPEFGWRCANLEISESTFDSQYFLFESKNVTLNKIKMSGKYSFQYMNNVKIKDSVLDTKDAFWHSKNVLIENCIVKGEYLAWFSENIVFKNCKIEGTQPFCYCKNLKLINCTMEGCDLAFEYSDVEADIIGGLVSIKNPRSGVIVCDKVDEIIEEKAIYKCKGTIKIRNK